jgi:stress response protein YsnF
MLDERSVSAAIGSTAYDATGAKIGTVEHFYVDDRTGAPSWVAVTTGLFGTRRSVVPALDATFTDGALRLPVALDAVKSAPHLTGDHLSPDDETTLRRHYGTDRGTDQGTAQSTDHDMDHGTDDGMDQGVRQDTAGGETPSTGPRHAARDDDAMTRSEERLAAGTERVATTRARVVKYVVTEEVQITVPIRREEIRIEQVPLDAPDDGPGETLVPDQSTGTSAGDGGGLPDEIILHRERPVVTVEVVPIERVRVRTEVVEGQETVSGQVQREQIVADQTPSPRLSPT